MPNGYSQNQGGGAIPRQGIGSLNAPGIAAPTRVYSAKAERVQQALQIMGQGAQVFQQATVMVAQDRELRDQRLKGQAAQDWAIARVVAKKQIDEGQYGISDEADEQEVKLTHADVAAQFTDGKPKAYTDHFMAISAGETAAWLSDARQDRQDVARLNASYDLENAALANASPEDHFKTYDELAKLNPKWGAAQLDIPFLKAGQAAAEAGDTGKVLAAIQFLGNRHAGEQHKWEAKLVLAQAKQDAAQQEAIGNQVNALLAEEKTLDAKAFLDANKDKLNGDNRLKLTEAINSRNEKIRAREKEDALQVVKNSAATGVDADKITAVIDHLGGIYGSAWRDKAVKEHQEVYSNNIKRDIGLGRFDRSADGKPDVNATMARVIGDMDRPANDPRHLTAEQGAAILAQTEKRMKLDAQTIVVGQRLSAPPKAGSAPLGAQQDGALVTLMTNQYEVLSGVPGQDGAIEPTAIIAPAKFAVLADKAGRVPREVAGLIQRGFAGDAPQITTAAQALAALQSQNPALAEQVIDGMEPVAQMRAREVQSRVDLGVWVRAVNDTEFALEDNKKTNAQNLSTLTSMKYQPVKQAELEVAVYGPDAKTKEATKQQIVSSAFSVPEHEWFRFKDYHPTLNTAQKQEFFTVFEQEFQTALARTGNDMKAKDIATKKAATRFANNHQQIIWNGQAITTDAPKHLADPAQFRAAVKGELEAAGWTNPAHINDVLNATTPQWNPQTKAWIFVDQLGNPYTYSTKDAWNKVLNISLIEADGKGKYTADKVKELQRRLQEKKADLDAKAYGGANDLIMNPF